MIRNIAILSIAEIFERMSYYGVRSILVLFLTSSLVGLSRDESIELYGNFTLFATLCCIAGGLIADASRRPALIALIGSGVSFLGIMALACLPGRSAIIGVYIAAIGTGLFKPSIISSLYRQAFPKRQYFDFIITIFYLMINIGAFLAPLIIGSIGDTGDDRDFRRGFMVAALIILVPGILILSNYKSLLNKDLLRITVSDSSNAYNYILLVFFIIGGILFWVSYELIPILSGCENSSSLSILLSIGTFLFALVFLPLYLVLQFRGSLKLLIGFLMMGIILGSAPMLTCNSWLWIIIMGAGEILVAPILMSQFIQIAPPRMTATLLGLYMVSSLTAGKIVSASYTSATQHPNAVSIALGVLLVIVITLILLFYRLRRSSAHHQSD